MGESAHGHYEAPAVGKGDGMCRAHVAAVEPGSAAWEAGLEAGMVLVEVDGVPLRDIIEWRWRADGFSVEVTLDTGEHAFLERELGHDWGITFSDVIFDGLMLCQNACTFCFMRMLPPGMRPTLYERDDDYRLSFLQGNFVTLTNLDDAEVERIIAYGLQPLHVSLHAISPDVRRELMGPNAQRGLDVLERLLGAGLEVHAQLVIVPGVNDGLELTRTLAWVEAHSGILSCGIVPLGYTKYQSRFTSSFSDDPQRAAETIELIREFQEDSGCERYNPRFHISDEFYLDAGYAFPPARAYGSYPQFHDGIGMMRSFIDEFGELGELVALKARALRSLPAPTIVVGCAFERVLVPLVEESELAGLVRILAVPNRFFGGNVDVTCLLTGQDVLEALVREAPRGAVIMARETFDADLKTLDDMTLQELERRSGVTIRLCTYCARELIEALA